MTLPAGAVDLTQALLSEFMLPRGDGGPVPPALWPSATTTGTTAEAIPLPPATPPVLDPDAVLARRRTVRRFTDGAVPLGVVSAMLAEQAETDSRLAPGESAQGNGIELVVFANQVTGLPAGLYEAGDEELRPRGEVDMVSVLGQPGFASAALTVLVLGSIAAAVHRHGSGGYLRLLRRAGAAGHACWLAALARGFDGAVHANVRVSNQLIDAAGLDAFSRRALFSVAVGSKA
ncbi:nitroreductase family protein [Streptomyces sp. NL15-2K]|uniref:nitroreductase family protein n=1 Tax=Streptomyces sp. NL15-2K TaxID=376149 RepID=UPI000F56F08F|nr:MULTISPECIES: nitroreductase family protein [Actinomycetes]WKX10319.1 nitroreductase family protein [Kutzneria buriramensis]GCB48182.1 hypothetical protein SNL152K_5506 [Streptomyces sp. NL15-2K]